MGFFEDNYQHNSNNTSRVKWEYKKVINSPTLDMNELGEQGWELCGYDGSYGLVVFKRIKR